MTSRRLCGYDINGWRDSVGRNWRVDVRGEIAADKTMIDRTEPLSSIVKVGDRKAAQWIGGIQADLAPHGRGGGWGAVGKAERRIQVRELLSDANADPKLVAAAMTGLAHGAESAVLAIDDGPQTTERAQERLLDALKTMRIGRRMLVWRPVLAALFAIENGIVLEGQRVGVICHCAEGFSLQTLVVRRSHGRHTSVLAPERKKVARLVRSVLGYRQLVRDATAAVTQPRQSVGRMAGFLAMGLPAGPEVLRLDNGDWRLVQPPATLALPNTDLTPRDFIDLASCDCVLFESLAQGQRREDIFECVGKSLGRPPVDLAADAVARGALAAAQRIDVGDPVYFDFLPRLATIVSGAEGAMNFDLILPDETLSAGQVYRSPTPARLGLHAGQTTITIFLLKEGQPRPRRAQIEQSAPPTHPVEVELSVEQAPAAGRARILLTIPELGRQTTIDWDKAEDVDDDWETLIASQSGVAPTVPKRLVLQNSILLWDDPDRGVDLAAQVRRLASEVAVDWRALGDKLAQRLGNDYPISSDGQPPDELDDDTIAALDLLTQRALQHAETWLDDPDTLDDSAIKFLTWQFRHCPIQLTERLLNVAEMPGALDRYFPSAPKKVLFYQGMGRITHAPEHERCLLRHLLSKSVKAWHWRRETACAAFILSRSETAALLLDREDVDQLLTRCASEIANCNRQTFSSLRYATVLIVGLLRWRLKEPRSLIVGQDPSVDRVDRELSRAIADLDRRVGLRPWQIRLMDLMKQVREELRGAGGNPELLFDLYTLKEAG